MKLCTSKDYDSYLSHRIIDKFLRILRLNPVLLTAINFPRILKWKSIKSIPVNKTVHDFSLWLRTGSDPADINRIPSHTGKIMLYSIVFFLQQWSKHVLEQNNHQIEKKNKHAKWLYILGLNSR